jgi:hypothetical protein
MKSSDKKKYKYGFELNKPKIQVSIILIFLFIIVLGLLIQKKGNEIWKNLDRFFLVFSWFSLLTTPLVEWLRNIYVLIIWTLICLLYLFYKIEYDFLTSILPICILIYSQICRITFKTIFGYFPIHLLFNHNAQHRYSEINNRKSKKIDYRYSMIYSIVGIILSIIIITFKIKTNG